MSTRVERHHWLNTIVGVLDSAFHLTLDEQFAVSSIVNKLLAALRIPERGAAQVLPMPVVQEAHASYYSTSMATEDGRVVRGATSLDCVTSLETWRSALEDMVVTAYPDLSAEERILLAKVLSDLLAAIGVPNRAAMFFPDAVLKAHREIGDY